MKNCTNLRCLLFEQCIDDKTKFSWEYSMYSNFEIIIACFVEFNKSTDKYFQTKRNKVSFAF